MDFSGTQQIFSCFKSDPFQNSLSPTSSPETPSEYGSFNGRVNFYDEEVILASNNPKKRAGRKKFRETRHPVYRGVRLRGSGKWVCELREPNKKSRIWLGTFPTAEMGARAHDVAAIALRGRLACVNFADSAWRLPVPASADTKDIQRAAAEAAEAFRPPSSAANVASPDNALYMDDEALFGIHELLASMAEGMMLPPPPPPPLYNYDVEMDADVSLWSFSD